MDIVPFGQSISSSLYIISMLFENVIFITRIVISEICRQKFTESALLSTIVGLLDSQTGEVYQETVLDLLINLSEWGMCLSTVKVFSRGISKNVSKCL